MAYLYIFLVTVLFLSFINPVWGFIAFVANLLIGIGIRFPHFSSVSIFNLFQVNIMQFMFFCIIAGIISQKMHEKSEVNPSLELQDKVFLGFISVISLSVLINGSFGELAKQSTSLIIMSLTFFYGARLVTDFKSISLIINSIVIILVFLSLEGHFFPLAFIDLNSLSPNSELFDFLSKGGVVGEGRFVGTGRFDNSNEIALMVNIAFPFLFLYVKESSLVYWRIASLFSILSTVSLTVRTVSRAGFLGLFIMSFFLFVKREKRLIGLVIFAAAVFVVLPNIESVLNSRAVEERQKSAEERLTAWHEGRLMIKSNPIWGVGKGKFLEHHGLMPHNTPIELMAETGLVSMALWCVLIFLAFKKLNSIERITLNANREQRGILRMATGLKIALIGFLVTSFFGNQCYNPILYLFLGLPHSMYRIAIKVSNEAA